MSEDRSQATTIAVVTFAALIVATFATFFITQRLKREPDVVGNVGVTPFFSPNQDGRFDRAIVAFLINEPDDVTVQVIDRDGDPVRRLARNRPLPSYTGLRLKWDGKTDAGPRAPDGRYRVRVGLRRQGRSLVLARTIRLDTTPPRPRVLSIGPAQSTLPRPELLPNAEGQPARVRLLLPGTKPRARVRVFRTDVTPAREVLVVILRQGQRTWTWDGTVAGRRVAAGTYLVAVESRDRAGNIGTGSVVLPPRPGFGRGLGGRGGVSVRYLTVQPPSAAAEAATAVSFGVLAGGERYRWTVRRVGGAPRNRGRGTRPVVRLRAPGGASGLYLFEITTATRRATAPFPVQSAASNKVLVVLPNTTWQGENRVDDDGDGWPDTLTGGLPIRTARILNGDRLPDDVTKTVAPLLIELDRQGRRYDLTTDLALARGDGPKLDGHTGVILPGDARWVDATLQRRLRRWVTRGGRLFSVGTDSLRREVRVTPRRALEPTTAAPRDLFGAELGSVQRAVPIPPNARLAPNAPWARTSILVAEDPIELFEGTDGQFDGFTRVEPTLSLGRATRVVARATTKSGDKDVIVATRLGRGLVVRTGLPELPSRLRADAELQTLLSRIWVLLSR